MQAKIINGLEIRKAILEEIKAETAEYKAKTGKVPGLVTILVGENPASVSYVTLKVHGNAISAHSSNLHTAHCVFP